MRFEIKSGGVAAILVGIAALSGAVFMMGLLAGYDVGRESQTSAAQVATDYPLAAPPSSGESAAASAPAGSSATASAVPMPSPNYAAPPPRVAPLVAKPLAPQHPKPSHPRPASDVAASSERLATGASPPTGEVSAPGADADTADETGGGSASGSDAAASAPPLAPAAAASSPAGAHARHKLFNIQIQAAMDRSGADELVRRLQALGYQPHLAPVHLNGETWYKVVIGPYPTQEAAAAAQEEMHTKYNNLYGGGAPNPGAKPRD